MCTQCIGRGRCPGIEKLSALASLPLRFPSSSPSVLSPSHCLQLADASQSTVRAGGKGGTEDISVDGERECTCVFCAAIAAIVAYSISALALPTSFSWPHLALHAGAGSFRAHPETPSSRGKAEPRAEESEEEKESVEHQSTWRAL